MTSERERGLKFYPKSHRYKLDGEWVPGVTTILGVVDKPGLKKWAAASVANYVLDNWDTVDQLRRTAGRGPTYAMLKEVPWQKRDDAADRGTALHDIADEIVRGAEVDVPGDLVDVVENLLRFMSEWQIRPVLIEAVVGHRSARYAGKLDLIADYVNPRTGKAGRACFDYKSGKAIYWQTAHQNAGYCFAEFYGEGDGGEIPLPKVGASFGVHIRADDYACHPLPIGPNIHREFLTIRETFDIQKRANGDWQIPGSGYVGLPIYAEEDVVA